MYTLFVKFEFIEKNTLFGVKNSSATFKSIIYKYVQSLQ